MQLTRECLHNESGASDQCRGFQKRGNSEWPTLEGSILPRCSRMRRLAAGYGVGLEKT